MNFTLVKALGETFFQSIGTGAWDTDSDLLVADTDCIAVFTSVIRNYSEVQIVLQGTGVEHNVLLELLKDSANVNAAKSWIGFATVPANGIFTHYFPYCGEIEAIRIKILTPGNSVKVKEINFAIKPDDILYKYDTTLANFPGAGWVADGLGSFTKNLVAAETVGMTFTAVAGQTMAMLRLEALNFSTFNRTGVHYKNNLIESTSRIIEYFLDSDEISPHNVTFDVVAPEFAQFKVTTLNTYTNIGLSAFGSSALPNTSGVGVRTEFLGSAAYHSDSEYLHKALNLADIPDAAAARANLGFPVGTGSMALENTADWLSKAGNLTGIADAAVARNNLGLGTMAVEVVGNWLSKAGNLAGIADITIARTNLGIPGVIAAALLPYALLSGATFVGGVGIGVAPTGLFQVADTLAGPGNYLARFWNKTAVATDVGAAVLFQGGVTGNGLVAIGASFQGPATTDGGYFYIQTRAPTTGTLTEQFRITANGVIGFGTSVVDIWAAGYRQLYINRLMTLIASSSTLPGTPSAHLALNGYLDAASAWRYIGASEASEYHQDSGAHAFRVAAAGAAGAVIPWILALKILSDGKLGIGRTPTTYKAEVEGSVLANTGGLRSVTTSTRGLDIVQNTADNVEGSIYYNKILLTEAQAVNNAGHASNFFNALYIGHVISGANLNGGRNSLEVRLTKNSTTRGDNLVRFYVGAAFTSEAYATDGGTSPGPLGGVFAINPVATLKTGATFYQHVTAGECNINCEAGSSVFYKAGLTIVPMATDAVQGYTFDAGLSISAITGAVGFKNGILFSNANSAHPVAAAGTLIGTLGAFTVNHGIDFSTYTFTTTFLKSTNFQVDGNGSVEMGKHAVSNSPFIDFHSGAVDVDYDSRIIASGGTGAVSGGVLTLQCATINLPAGGVMKLVEVGAVDSGGVGFRMLRVTN